MTRLPDCSGYILLPVVLTLAVVAAVAFLLTQQGAFNAGSVIREQQKNTALYAAEAGLNHAKWKLDRLNCSGYTDIANASLGAHSYSASITDSGGTTLAAGSPANISVTGTHANGGSYTLNRAGVKIYESVASTSILQPDAADGQDSWIYEFNKTTNYGSDASNWISNGNGSIGLALLKFDLGSIPTNAIITGASLSLFQLASNDSNVPVSAHRITQTWNEAFVTWNNRDNGIAWNTAGGDFDTTAQATTNIGPSSNKRVEWDLTTLVQNWVEGTYANNGLALRTEATNIFGEQFLTSDHSDPTRRPSLTVTYVCECGVGGGSGSIVLQPGASSGKDSRTNASQPNKSYGSLNDASVDPSVPLHALVEFDLSEFVPGVTVSSAQLELYTGGADAATTASMTVHRITQAWIEGSGGTSGLQPANGVTHNTYDGINAWLTPGGDYVPTPVDTVSVTSPAAQWYQWNVQSLVQEWASGSSPNYGFIIDSSGDLTKMHFKTSDSADATQHPKLSISYSCGCGVPSASGSLILQPGSEGKDTYLNSFGSRAESSHGVDTVITIALSSAKHGLLEFDLSSIPSNAVVTSADLDLYLEWGGTPGTTLSAYRLTQSWLEGTNSAPSASTDGASWNKYDAVTPWASAGADYDPTPVSQVSMTAAPDTLTLDVSTLVAGWVNGTNPNYGLLLQAGAGFGTADFSSSDKANASQRPKLTINYSCPCGIGCTPAAAVPPNVTLSTQADASLGGLSYTSSDLAEYNPTTDTALLRLDGSAIGVSQKIDAIHLLENGHILLSLDNSGSIGGLSVDKSDLVDYDPVANSASLVLDGSAVFSGPNNDISAVYVKADGKLILASAVSASLAGLSFQPEDLVEYDPATNTASLFLDGSAIGLIQAITSVHLLENGHIILSFNNSETIGGLSVTNDDLVDYDPVTDTASLYFDGQASFGSDEKLYSVHIGAGSGTVDPPVQQGYLDQFNSHTCAALDFTGSDGSLDWSASSWDERSEGDGPCAGLTQIGDDPVVPEAGSHRLILNERLSGVSRTVDLSALANATLSFDYRRDNYPTTGDRFLIEVHDGIGSGWIELDSISGIANDPAYLSASYDISALATASTRIRFSTEGFNTVQTLYLDNIKISEEAAAPVAPTNFGFDTIFDQTQNGVRRKQIATQVSLLEDGTITSISAHVGGSNKVVRYAIYSDVAGEPGALLAESADVISDFSMSWLSIDVPATALTAGTYWLALSFDHNAHTYTYQTGGETRYLNHRATGNGYTANWGSSNASFSRTISIFGTYTPAN